jgi:hypothetical protein
MLRLEEQVKAQRRAHEACDGGRRSTADRDGTGFSGIGRTDWSSSRSRNAGSDESDRVGSKTSLLQ